MTSVLFAALSALVWGVGDYCGGKATQLGSRALAVTVISQVLSVPVLVICLLILPGSPRPADLAWGATAGVAGLFGIVLLYRALSAGAMAVVAPVTAVTAAVVPLGAGLMFERIPGGLALTGAGFAVGAIALVSLGPREDSGKVSSGLIGLALGAGALFGVFFSLLGQVSGEAGMWSLVAVRAGSISIGLAVVVATRTPLRLTRPAVPWALVAGPLDVAANALFIVATFEGHLSVVAPIAALYPASTVLLALAIDKERLRPIQLAGLGLAATALVLASS
ncbi:MAG TPA: DMT family transporter [Micromonosporaceae bacterium]|nr:DMT family transporter [Micromonosporaceae bacterium]